RPGRLWSTADSRFFRPDFCGRRAAPGFPRMPSRGQPEFSGGTLVMPKLQGRVALVTGAGRGIGRAIALALAREGARVAVTARTRAELDEATTAIRSGGGEGLAVVADLTERTAVPQVIQEVTAVLGPVEILVNNAGIGSSANPKPVAEFDDAFWDL